MAGVDTKKPELLLDQGEALENAGEYRKAYGKYAHAYKLLTK